MEVKRSPSTPVCGYPSIHGQNSDVGQGNKGMGNGEHFIIHDEEVVPFIESRNYSEATYILH